jgi:hypothetical protein
MIALLILTTTACAQWGETAAEKAQAFGALSERVATHFADLRETREFPACRVTYYHPREAGSSWRRWANCRSLGTQDLIPGPGGKVRPGVACVAAADWSRWGGKLLFVEGQGLVQVLDADSYRGRSRTIWFDLAVPGPPWAYAEWLGSDERVAEARAWSGRARFSEVSREEVLRLLADTQLLGQQIPNPCVLQDSLGTPPASG